jgi:hypothetical protein
VIIVGGRPPANLRIELEKRQNAKYLAMGNNALPEVPTAKSLASSVSRAKNERYGQSPTDVHNMGTL